MMRYADTQFGGVDILSIMPGYSISPPVEAFLVEKWNDIIAINLSSVFHTADWRCLQCARKLGTIITRLRAWATGMAKREVVSLCRR